MSKLLFLCEIQYWLRLLILGLLMLESSGSFALPSFANQTGQNCMACHAGGQFPELTPYGRLFKLTGYTLGERALSPSVMGVAGGSNIKNISNVNTAMQVNSGQALNLPLKNNSIDFETGSVFLAGKINDNLGAFTQFTYDRFGGTDSSGNYSLGTFGTDSMDIRYADQIVTLSKDLIYGFSLNNRPSVSDPWNTSPAWMQYVPQSNGKGSNAFSDANTAYPANGLTGNAAGLSAYAFLNKTYYAEIGFYRTANSFLSSFNSGNDANYLSGKNTYWRIAYNKEWGPENIMIGMSGFDTHYFDPNSTGLISDSNSYLSSQLRGVDFQYQYLLDPHTVTLQGTFQKQSTNFAPNDSPNQASALVNVMRLKGSYIYQAKYGTSLAYFNYTDGSMQGGTYEIFWNPLQNVRLGLQYTAYDKLTAITAGGLAAASDANTLRLYIWTAY